MTPNSTQTPTVCPWCGTEPHTAPTAGRPRRYCSDDCRRAAEAERRTLRNLIARLELEVIEQTGRFTFGAQDSRPRLAAARERWEQLTAHTPGL